MKRATSLLLALLLGLSMLTACGGNNAASNPSGPANNDGNSASAVPSGVSLTAVEDTLTVGARTEPVVLDPPNENDAGSVVVCWQIYEPLIMRNNTTGEYEPVIAESWEQIDEYTTRFHIREGIKDHLGNTFDANDVYYSVQRGCESSFMSYIWDVFDPEGTTVIDDYTIDIKTRDVYAAVLPHLSHYGALMVSQDAVESAASLDEYGRNPTGGTGPWKFVEWLAGDRVVLERNEDYYGKKPYFKNLVIRTITDDTTRAMSLESGDIDFDISVSTAQMDSLEANPAVDIYSVISNNVTYLTFNTQHTPLDDVRVRQALRYALDMEGMVQVAFNGTADAADSMFCNRSCYVKTEKQYTQDLDKARELLAEAGYPDGFSIKLWTSENQARIDLCDMIHNAWSQIGVEADVQILEFATLLEKGYSGEYDCAIKGFVFGGDDGDFLHDNFYTSPGDYHQNSSGYSNPRFDELSDEARKSLDPEVRQACYAEIQEILNEDLPWMPIATPNTTYGIRATLTGIDPDPKGFMHFRDIEPK